MKNKLVYLIFLLLAVIPAAGKGPSRGCSSSKHEVRLGIGDMFFETLVWNNQVHKNYAGALPGSVFTEKRDYFYTPHISAEYAYHILPWMSLGGTVDFQYTGWKNHRYDNENREVGVTDECFANLCIMPTARFNYFRREHVGLYSAVAAGLDINCGTETDIKGNHTGLGAAIDLRFIGVTAGSGHWWGFAELGGTYALRNGSCFYMVNSQIFKVGVSYKF